MLEIDMLDFEAMKIGVANYVDKLIEEDRAKDILWNEKRTRPYYTIGVWWAKYRRLANRTKQAITSIEASQADWKSSMFEQDLKEEAGYREGVIEGLETALGILRTCTK